ncbi:MAG: metallophosphoesterase family protein [Bacilli bacterium]|nr:metallophosphoesterase family protein [Bacilli bacterium]
MTEKTKQKEILYVIKNHLLMYKKGQRYRTFKEICELLNLSEKELIQYIDILNEVTNEAVTVKFNNETPTFNHRKKEYKTHEFHIPKNKFKLCFVSDKHIGHKDDRIQYVHEVYEEAEKRGVDLVFDLGDLLNGPIEKAKKHSKVKIGNLEDSIIAAQKFHQSKIPTHFLAGNHDIGFMDTDGCDIGKLIEQECKNLYFLNNLFAPIEINGLRLNLSHGYIEQKYLHFIKLFKEYKFLTINDPHIILQGHFHRDHVSENNDTILCQVPSLRYSDEQINQNSTKAYGNNIGAIFLSVEENRNEYDLCFEEMEIIETKKLVKVAEYTKKR